MYLVLENIKKFKKSAKIEQLTDVRTLGLIVFGVISLLVTWSGIKVVQTNYNLQKEISTMQQENDLRRLENSNIALQNQYLQTDQYLELTARKQFNKALPGEKLLIVPKSVALSHTIELPEESKEETPIVEESGPWYERNFNAWMEFVFRREG